MRAAVDPFIGTAASDLPPTDGLAATWWWPKAQVGNTHPGACHPLGMVSACAYSGAYPTGYGLYDLNTEGRPRQLFDRLEASGFTHFQQSGTGAIRKYYNYARVTPMLTPLDDLGTAWALQDEHASPGWYRATLDTGITCELTVGPKSAVHRYTFPRHDDARVVLDLSHGGLAIDHGRTVPVRATLESVAPGVARGEVTVEGVPVAVHVEVDAPEGWRQLLWYDRRLMVGGRRLEFDAIRETTLRPFGLLVLGPATAGEVVEVRLGFSLRGVEQAEANLHADCGRGPGTFASRRQRTETAWADHLGRVAVEGDSADQHRVFATALYHSLVKPSFAPDESPFWPGDGPWVFDISTMWDIYKTQLPLLTTIAPDRAVELVVALLTVCEEEGNLPIGYRMARGSDRFFRQASALAHTLVADIAHLGLGGGIAGGSGAVDWDWALVNLHADLRRAYGEEFVDHGVAHPVTHTLDLAEGYACTAEVARMVGDDALADRFEELAGRWVNAYDPATGLLVDSTFYEGGRWNYSFRLLHDMAGRIELAGGDDRFVELLDRFFGHDAPPVEQLGEPPLGDAVAAGYALHRFEGLNNEPDMEAPWSYHYAGRPDRTAEVVHAVLAHQFTTGRGGLPGNDDSGGLSSWYVWASLGLFPVAGQHRFLLHPPAFPHAVLDVDGHELVVEAPGRRPPVPGEPPQHVVAVHLDDRPLDRTWLDSRELREASRLRFELGTEPSAWGRDVRPPTMTTRPTTETDDERPASGGVVTRTEAP